jgi:hypothetical protein
MNGFKHSAMTYKYLEAWRCLEQVDQCSRVLDHLTESTVLSPQMQCLEFDWVIYRPGLVLE